MRFQSSRRLGYLAFACVGIALGACQGNIGGGSGLSIPQAPGYGQPAGPNGSANGNGQSRERVLDGAVFLTSKLTEVPLPQLAGFGVTIALGTPGPVSAETESAEATSSAGRSLDASRARALHAAALAAKSGTSPLPHASSASSADPAAGAGSASPSDAASAVPSAGASAVVSPVASGATPAPKPSHSASPSPNSSEHPHIDTKIAIYPDDAPPPPTPVPTGEVQTFVHRAPLIRGYLLMGTDLSMYGLGAVHFTLPTTEITPKRGFTIAVYESGKHRKNRLMDYDTEPTIGEGVVYSAKSEPITLKKGHGYLLMIYGDDEPAPAGAVPAGYPGPGNNPFPVGSGAPQPGYTQVPGGAYVPPTPYNPYATPTPVNPYAPTAFPTSPFGSPHP